MSDNPSSLASPETGPPPPPPPPRPGWATAAAGGWGVAAPPPQSRKPAEVISPATVPLVVLVLGSAFMLNLAIQSNAASVAGLLSILGTASAIGYRKWEAGILTLTSSACLTLAAAAGLNLVLRTALVVTIPTWLMILALLSWGASDVTFASVTRQIGSIVQPLVDLTRVPAWLVGSLDTSTRHRSWVGSLVPVVRGIVLALLVTIPVVLLLASGDRAFGDVVTPSGADLGDSVLHVAFTGLFFLAIAAICVTAGHPRDSEQPRTSETKSFPLEALIVMASLVTALGLWCAVQINVRAGGADAIFEAPGLTRADYAREGFFQLVAAASIVIAVLASCGPYFRRSSNHRSNVARCIGLLLAAETVTLTVVAFSRLGLYTKAYGLTSTRLAVGWFLAWLGAVLMVYALRIALGFEVLRPAARPDLAERWRVLPLIRSLLCATVLLYGLSNPDLLVATNNLDRSEQIVKLDQEYLLSLSSDATPAIFANAERFDENATRVVLPDRTRRGEVGTSVETFSRFDAYCLDKKDQDVEYGSLGWNYGVARSKSLAQEQGCLG